MKNVTIEDLLKSVATYNAEEVEKVRLAYEFAYEMHKGQYRQSGEEYISHPVAVAYILSEMHADRETLIAALLHDVLEDTKCTKEELAKLFGENVANLVDGVTKISKLNFTSKVDEDNANTRKLLSCMMKDVRIIIIKIADRLHNMRTIDAKSREKKIENAIETMQVHVPLAYIFGAYRIKSELEDICFEILMPEKYSEYSDILEKFREDSQACVDEMLYTINSILNKNFNHYELKMRPKNVYGVYKGLKKYQRLYDIHDLLALKIMVDEEVECYRTLGLVHSAYKPVNDKFKDYICNPKTNMYQGLHTTVFGPDQRLIQTQIRTFDMDKVASFGITTYWDICKGEARQKMQDDLSKKFQFYNSLMAIDNYCTDNQEFMSLVRNEILTDKIYVCDSCGCRYELPKDSTLVDLAYRMGDINGDTLVGGIVNGRPVGPDYVLHNNEIVQLINNISSYGARTELLEAAKTTYAKQKIMKLINNG